MTIDKAIKRITEHMIIHKMKEPQAIKITEALCMAIEALEKSKWKSVEDETPNDEREVLVKLIHTYADDNYYEYSIARYLKFNGDYHWADNKYGYLEWNKYSNGHDGSSLYKVVEWKEI